MEHIINLMIINAQNVIGNYDEYTKHSTIENNISDNPYPVFYVGKKPVYEGDAVLYAGGSNVELRIVMFQMRYIIKQNADYAKSMFINVSKAQEYIKHKQNDSNKT